MKRRLLATTSLAVVATIALSACDRIADNLSAHTAATANAFMSKIVLYGQGALTPLRALATAFGVSGQSAVAIALNAAGAAVNTVSGQVGSGAVAVANAAVSTNLATLLADAGQIVLAALRIMPGSSSVVGIVQDAIEVAPLVEKFAQTILHPDAVGAGVVMTPAAARLGLT